MKRSGAIGNKVAVTRRHIGEYDANRRLDSHDIRKITKDLILVNNEVSTKFGGVAQLGEHLLCKQGVIGSIPFISTRTEMSKRIRVQGAGQPPIIQDMGL